MYEYIPNGKRKHAKIIACLLFAATAAAFLPGVLKLEYYGLFQAAGFVFAVCAVMITTRFLVSGFSYSVEYTASGADLVIFELRGSISPQKTEGKGIKTVRGRLLCRVSASEGELYKYTKEARAECKKRGISLVNYCTDILPDNSYIFIPSDSKELAVRFEPDEKMISFLGESFL